MWAADRKKPLALMGFNGFGFGIQPGMTTTLRSD
jgi:hypothetical protein